MTKLTLETSHGTYAAEIPQDDLNIDAVFEDLVKPVLYAAGFHPHMVMEYLEDYGE